MGNCAFISSFQRQKAAKLQMVKIMTVDGKVLAYRPPPLKIHEALSQFPGGHAISESLPVVQHLDPEADMLGGNLYYLLPQQVEAEKKNDEQGSIVMRIRLVVSKKELKEMLISKGGGVMSSTLGEMIISELQSRRPAPPAVLVAAPPLAGGGGGGGHSDRRRSWRPALESIPESTND